MFVIRNSMSPSLPGPEDSMENQNLTETRIKEEDISSEETSPDFIGFFKYKHDDSGATLKSVAVCQLCYDECGHDTSHLDDHLRNRHFFTTDTIPAAEDMIIDDVGLSVSFHAFTLEKHDRVWNMKV